MAALKGIDASIRTLALTNYSVFLKRAALLGSHKRAAELLNIPASTESEYCTDQMEHACQVLAAYGLQVAEKGAGTIPVDQTRAFMVLASAHMERLALEQQAHDTSPGALGPAE